jgi:surfeit locus 1 family protein
MSLRRTAVGLAALALALLTARLGVWQLDRVRQKTDLQAQIEDRSSLPPLPAAELARDATAAPAQWYRRVTLRGRWLAGATVYLDNRSLDDRAGFVVVTPLRFEAGDAVLVQRGWVPRDPADRTRLAPIVTPPGEVEIDGRVAPPPPRWLQLGADAPGAIRQNLDLAAFAREIRVPLRPVTVQQFNRPGAAADGLLRRWPAPAIDVATNRGYAVQWFALCALTIGLYVWFQFIAPRRLPRTRPAD